jgi:single-stranded-DNA-specific exonuclease
MDERAAFLGVTSSARGLIWRDRLPAAGLATAEAISQRHGLPELLGRVLAGRNIAIDEVPVHLEPTIKALMPDPSRLQDMDAAAARIADAIDRRERVAIFGDYDVDGAASSALMHRFLAHHGLTCDIYIPDRLFEGYGPNPDAIRKLAKDGATLIITVDCGTTSFDALAVARDAGAEVIVVDHHQADERLPDVCAVVNPNRQDDMSGLGHLCAAGVVFMLLVAIQREGRRRGFYDGRHAPLNLIGMLDIVALATVCDVVPLKTLNRAYVTRGLAAMRTRENIGLRALADAAGLDQAPTAYHLGFVLGPRINAGGRIGDSALGARLLSIDDDIEAARIATLLDKLNRERKAIEVRMLEEAVAEADRLVEADPGLSMLMLGSEQWHKGIVGLVASRLTERFQRPTCVIAWGADAGNSKDEGTGSLRSVNGVDIGSAVRKAVAVGLLKKGGGHAMAAGLTLSRDHFDQVSAFLNAEIAASAADARERAALDIDGALTAGGATADLMSLIERAGPFGQGNPQPRFVLPAHRIKFAKGVGESHIRCVLEAGDGSRLDAVAFRAAGQPLGELLTTTSGAALHIAGTLKRDTWGGRNRIEFTIEDAAPPLRRR